MTLLLETALSNVLMAAALAVPALLVGWWGRRPALTHGLWLLVLLKLITPPVFRVPVTWPETPESAALAQPDAIDAEAEPQQEPAPEVAANPAEAVPWQDESIPAPAPGEAEVPPALADAVIEAEAPEPAPIVEETSPGWGTWLCVAWLAGSVAWMFVTTRCLARFRRLLRFARPAPLDVQAEAEQLAKALGVRCPRVVTLPGAISPMLWAVGRAPWLLLPEALLGRLGDGQRATLLAHELAHLRRGDHRVRWLEVLVLAVYWWCPLAWWARAQLRQAEEECCDAWVVALLPDSARAYALALVETLDFLSNALPALPPAASGIGHVRFLERRLTMILRGSTPQSLPRAGLLALAGLALVLLPFVPGLAQPPANEPASGVGGPGKPRDSKVDPANPEILQAQQELERVRAHLEVQRALRLKELQQLQRELADLRAREAVKAGMAPAPLPHGSPPPKAGHPAGIEQRLEQIERKLDALLWEITSLRRDISRKPASPYFTPGGPTAPLPVQTSPGGAAGPTTPTGGVPFVAPPAGIPGKTPPTGAVNPGPYLGGGPTSRTTPLPVTPTGF